MNREKWMQGLNDSQVEKSRQEHGTNTLAKKEMESLWSMFLGAFDDIWIKVLCGALVLKIILSVLGAVIPALAGENDVVEIISIILAIALATGFGTLSEYRNRSRSDALQEEYSKTYAKVMRNGKLVKLPTGEIVKGDTVLIQAGDKVPVDGVLVEGRLKVSQAVLNGESREETKTAAENLDAAKSTDYGSASKLFMGSVVTAGEGYLAATVIGDATELGKINKALTEEEEERKDTSSLKLEVVAAGIGKLGVSAAAIAGVLHVVLSLIRAEQAITVVSVLLLLAEAVMLMASIVIMAVPEGLPMMNSLVQSMNTESMYKKNILVSHKAAFSDSAYMNMLFSDKTGTITQGNLSLVEFITGDGKIVKHLKSKEFLDAITLNNLSKVSAEGKAIGSNNMDRALLTYALENGYREVSGELEQIAESSGFDSEKKCAEVTLKNGTVYWKGAAEGILDQVTHYQLPDGRVQIFSEKEKQAVKTQMAEEAKRTMKLLAAVKKENGKTILLAVLCLRDNVRPDAVETVEILNDAGIQVVMVTGDAEETAVSIAREAGILQNEKSDAILTHEQLEKMSDEEVKRILPRLRVVSRAKPLDKKRLVLLAQSMDNVCGMTGDGVNDAPALKQADIGFAMGDGTAVAQEAGDVVILNNSLTSIKDCVLNSRTMAKSVGKFLIFQLTVNISTLLMNILAPILGWTEPFSIVQILWINLIMDTLAAMAFGGEPILDRYMKEAPAKRTDPILTGYIKSAIGVSAVFITLGSILILEDIGGIASFVTPADCADPELYKKTFMFAFFIYAIIFNSLNTRSETWNLVEHLGENRNFVLVMGAIFVLQTVIIEAGGQVFQTTALSGKALVVSMLLALLIIPADLMRKRIVSASVGRKG